MSISVQAPTMTNATRFRRAMGHMPTGVAIITTAWRGELHGMTVGSLSCASYDPPMVAFFTERGSGTAQAIADSGVFGVNLLGRGDEELCYRFASARGDRFADVDLTPSDSGAPRFTQSILWLDCSLESTFEAGDHLGFVGRVEDYDPSSYREQPLVYCKSRLAPLHASSGRHMPTELLNWW